MLTQCPRGPQDPPEPAQQRCFQRRGQHMATNGGETGAAGGRCSPSTSTAVSWLLTVSVSLLALKVHTSAERVSFQAYMYINLIFS